MQSLLQPQKLLTWCSETRGVVLVKMLRAEQRCAFPISSFLPVYSAISPSNRFV